MRPSCLAQRRAARDEVQIARLPYEQAELDQTLAQLTSTLSASELEGAMTKGRMMGVDDAVLFALEKGI